MKGLRVDLGLSRNFIRCYPIWLQIILLQHGFMDGHVSLPVDPPRFRMTDILYRHLSSQENKSG